MLDCYLKEINGVEDCLKFCFGWGLMVVIELLELEICVVILMKKVDENDICLLGEVVFFIVKCLCLNVCELEGVLNCVIVNVNFIGWVIIIDFVCEVLCDLLVLQEKLVIIDNI